MIVVYFFQCVPLANTNILRGMINVRGVRSTAKLPTTAFQSVVAITVTTGPPGTPKTCLALVSDDDGRFRLRAFFLSFFFFCFSLRRRRLSFGNLILFFFFQNLLRPRKTSPRISSINPLLFCRGVRLSNREAETTRSTEFCATVAASPFLTFQTR